MNLREQYETLLRRGMPKHKRIFAWEDARGFCIKTPYPFPQNLASLHGSDARDLITMHALRWLKTLPGMRGGCQRWQGGWNVFLDDDYWSGKKNDPRIYKFAANECLDAILAATAHLEPKKTLA